MFLSQAERAPDGKPMRGELTYWMIPHEMQHLKSHLGCGPCGHGVWNMTHIYTPADGAHRHVQWAGDMLPPASWPPNPAALVCFGSLPLSPADHSVFISVGRVHLGLWSWGYLPLLYWLAGFVTSLRVRLGLLLISGPLAVKSPEYLNKEA